MAIGLAPYRTGELTALARLLTGQPAPITPGQWVAINAGALTGAACLTVIGWSVVATIRRRARHRGLLTLVGEPSPGSAGVTVVDHPAVAAYCLPGRRPDIVVTSGALRVLSAATAVIFAVLFVATTPVSLLAMP